MNNILIQKEKVKYKYKFMNNNTLVVSLPNGLKISGFTSESQAMRVARGAELSEGVPVAIKEKKLGRPVGSKSKKRKKSSRASWSPEEANFILDNLDQSSAFMKRTFLANKHTKNAIAARFYNMRQYMLTGDEALSRQLDSYSRSRINALREESPSGEKLPLF